MEPVASYQVLMREGAANASPTRVVLVRLVDDQIDKLSSDGGDDSSIPDTALSHSSISPVALGLDVAASNETLWTGP